VARLGGGLNREQLDLREDGVRPPGRVREDDGPGLEPDPEPIDADRRRRNAQLRPGIGLERPDEVTGPKEERIGQRRRRAAVACDLASVADEQNTTCRDSAFTSVATCWRARSTATAAVAPIV